MHTHPVDEGTPTWERYLHAIATTLFDFTILRGALLIWSAYAASSFIGAAMIGEGLVSVYDALIGVPLAWLTSWLWCRATPLGQGAAVLAMGMLVLIGVFAGAASTIG